MKRGWRCVCGAYNAAGYAECEACGTRREGTPTTPALRAPACEGCGEVAPAWRDLTRAEDGRWRCAGCHVEFLRGRVGDPAAPCPEAGCAKRQGEHREEFRQIVASAAWQRFTTRRREGAVP